MMKMVSEIKRLSGGRCLIELEDGSSFPLYTRELAVYGIEEENELPENVYEQLMQEILPKRARLKAMHLLEKMDRTEYQLRSRLISLSYPECIVEDAVSYVKQYHYVDDLRYAVSYMEFRKDKKSMRQILQELRLKGISSEILEEARQQVELPDEEHQIRSWIEKRHYDPETAGKKDTDRMYRFLVGKGYSISAITHVLRTEIL